MSFLFSKNSLVSECLNSLTALKTKAISEIAIRDDMENEKK